MRASRPSARGLEPAFAIGTRISGTDQVLENAKERPDRGIAQRLNEFLPNLFSYAATQKILTAIVTIQKGEVIATSRYVGLVLCQVVGGCVIFRMGDAP